jgi:biotin-dependent carboxylase-like uncharacterized protein
VIEILQSGPANSVQDLGRSALLHIGVGRSGPMDSLSLRLANALVGNAAGVAAIEVSMYPFRVRFGAPCVIALAGADAGARLSGRAVPPYWVMPVEAGDELVLSPPEHGQRTVLAIRGGIDVPLVLGARATDLKSGFGGLDGRGLQRGDRLSVLPHPDAARPPAGGIGWVPGGEVAAFWRVGGATATVRAIPAAEWDKLTPSARQTLLDADWAVSFEANRQGYRLEGPVLTFVAPLELHSHGLLPGVVQVPPSGQPIVQLADANTAGGYPKALVVIAPDLWTFGQLGPGGVVRFRITDVDAALDAARVQTALVQSAKAAVAG